MGTILLLTHCCPSYCGKNDQKKTFYRNHVFQYSHTPSSKLANLIELLIYAKCYALFCIQFIIKKDITPVLLKPRMSMFRKFYLCNKSLSHSVTIFYFA